MAGIADANGSEVMDLVSLMDWDLRGSVPPSSMAAAAEEKTVYVAVGIEAKENEQTLFWAIQHFGGWKLCILHVHQPANLAPLLEHTLEGQGMDAFREMERKIMQKKLDGYLSTCSDFGVRAEKVHIEMNSVEEGITELVQKHKIKMLVMGAASDGTYNMNSNEPNSRKAKYVRLRAAPFCTVYFIRNGALLFTRSARNVGPSAENDLPSSSVRSQTAEVEALCKVPVLEKLYAEELSKRKVVEQELEKMKNELEKLTKEAQDQKVTLEQKIELQEQQINEMRQKMACDSGMLSCQEQERNDLQVKLDEATKLVEELLNQALEAEDQTRTVSSNLFSTLSSSEVAEAANGFDPSMMLGGYDHGIIYKGLLYNTPVSIRLLTADGLQISSFFEHEVEVLSKFRHPNLANLMGADQAISAIVYEHLPNGSLEDRLMCIDQTPPLSWQTRIKIALDLCSALIFLHTHRPQSVVHGALRPSCILLDSNFTCKLIGFDFAHIISHDGASTSSVNRNSDDAAPFYISSYTDPDFIETGEASPESDVYSFGIILLQMLTGKPTHSVVEEVRNALDEDELGSVFDESAGDWPFLQAEQLARLSLRCCSLEAGNRPDLKSEVWRLMEPMRTFCGSALSLRLREAPSYFLCPISYEVMRDPHMASDGHTYEAEVLRQWLETGHNTSPMTNLPLQNEDLIPNLALRSAIQEWLQHQ